MAPNERAVHVDPSPHLADTCTYQENRTPKTTKALKVAGLLQTKEQNSETTKKHSTAAVAMNHLEYSPPSPISPNDSAQRVPNLPDSDEAHIEPKRSRYRMLFTGEQLDRLRQVFKDRKYPKAVERMQLAQSLGVSHKSVKQWFQNARSKLKKRGTDHVTGFYANKLAARRVTLPDSSVVVEYGRFKITGGGLGEQDPAVHNGESAAATDGLPRSSSSTSRDTTHDHSLDLSESAASSAGSGNERSGSTESAETSSRLETSASLTVRGRGSAVSGLSPLSTEEDDEDAAVPHPAARKQLRISPPSLDASSRGFHVMRQVSLPADHPFCNLGNREFVWPERCRRSPNPQSATAVRCEREHDNTEPCSGQTHDDILANYLGASTPAAVSSLQTSLHRESPASISERLGSPRLSHADDETPRSTQEHSRVTGLKRWKLSSDNYYSGESSPERNKTSRQARVQASDDESEAPLDLSMKGKQEREAETTAPEDQGHCKLFRPYPLKFTPTTAADKPVPPMFHPLPTPMAYPFPLHPFGLLPLRLPAWYRC